MARRVCAVCRVRLLCRECGLNVSYKDAIAIYGGMSAGERRKARTALLTRDRPAS